MSFEQKVQEQIQGTGSASDGQNGGPSFPAITPAALSHSEQIDQIIPALAAAKREFNIAVKDETNPFYKSKYADLAAIERAIGPGLTKHGLFVMQPAQPSEHVSGSVYVRITTILWHESGQFLSSSADVPYMGQRGQNQKGPVQVDVHGMGSMLTYFRRYLKLAFFDIITDDDDGNRAMPPASRQPVQHQPVQYQPQPQNIQPEHTETHALYQSAASQVVEQVVEYAPSAEEIKQLEQDIKKLDDETQEKLSIWLKDLGLSSVNELRNGRFQKIRLRVDQKLRDAEIDAVQRVVKLVELQKQSKIPMKFIGKFVSHDNLKRFADLPNEAVSQLLDNWENLKKAWKEHKPIAPKQLKQLLQACKDNNLPEWALLQHLSQSVKLDNLKELPVSIFQKVLDKIPEIVEEMATAINGDDIDF